MGIDGYALSFNYISDVFHVIANKGTEDFDKETQSHFIKGEYKVTNKSNRVGMLLDGEKIKHITMICLHINLLKRNDSS